MESFVSDVTGICHELLGFLRANVLAKSVECDENTRLSSIGVDSLALVEILLFIERRFKISVPDSHLTRKNLETIQALAHCVNQLLMNKKCSDVHSE